MLEDLPLLTPDLPFAEASYKETPEDFRVFEIPAYAPNGKGTHVFFEIEKSGISTHEAVRRVAQALGVAPRSIGYAGLKDSQALTRQVLSVEHQEPRRVEALELAGLRVLWANLHGNRLRIGHLAGNRFVIRLRGTNAESEPRVRAKLRSLEQTGVPNYFGEQRFGVRGDSWCVGRALLLGDSQEAVAWLVGRPGPRDHGQVRRARELYEAGDYDRAARAWPGNFRDQIRLCSALAKKRGDAARALHAVDLGILRLTIAAYQGWLFNQVVAERLPELERVLLGDLAWKHDNGAVFLVEDTAVEQARAERQAISPSGPLFGRKTTMPRGRPLEIELGVLARAGHTANDFLRRGALEWQGARRPLRFPLGAWQCASGVDEDGDYIELGFSLPPGCYATSVLREILG